MNTPTLRPVTPSTPTSSRPGLLDAAMSEMLLQSSPTMNSSESMDESDTIVRESPPFITQHIVASSSHGESMARTMPLPQHMDSQGSARVRPQVYPPTPDRHPVQSQAPHPQIPYPREITTSGKRPTKRPSGDVTQPSVVPRKQARHDPWVRPVLIDLPQTSSEVYAGYAALSPSLSDPRRAPHRVRASAKALRMTPLPVPLEGRPWQHVLYDHSSVDDEERAEPVHRRVHSVSTVPSRAQSVARSDMASRASAFSQVSAASQDVYDSIYSGDTEIHYMDQAPPLGGDHPPTSFALAPAAPIPEQVYGPDPFDCPLAHIVLPTTEPMDIETAKAHPRVKLLVDAIYLNPLTKEKLSEMYKKYPRPADLETLHKTRLNEDLARQLAKKSKESVITGDAPMRSLQWSLQFLARPLVEVITHLVSGETPDSKFIVAKVVDALKLTAKASWKANDLRRGRIYASFKGAGLEVAQSHENHSSFKFLLGDNPKDQILARQREDELLRDVVAAARPKHNQGNGQGGHKSGRHTQKHNQSSHHRGSGRGNQSAQGNRPKTQDQNRQQGNKDGGSNRQGNQNRGGKSRGQGRRGGNNSNNK